MPPATASSAIPPGAVRTRAVVIGCGNSLFGDDGVGPRAAEMIGATAPRGVLVRAVPELTPELAVDLAATEAAYFIDAALHGDAVGCVPLERAADDRALNHALTPAALLALSARAFGRSPPAWLVLVPGEDFTLGCSLSARAARALAEAVDLIRRRL